MKKSRILQLSVISLLLLASLVGAAIDTRSPFLGGLLSYFVLSRILGLWVAEKDSADFEKMNRAFDETEKRVTDRLHNETR